MTALIASLVASIGYAKAPDVTRYVQDGLRDATFTAEILQGDQKALKKINDDFARSYRYKSTTFSLKEPLMFRVDVRVEDTNLSYIVNGTTQWFKLAGSHLKLDLTKSPGKRQTALDVGLLTPSLIQSLYDAKYVRTEGSNVVFDLTFKQADIDPSRQRVWIDATKKYIVKREWYGRTGALRATFSYSDPAQVSGHWLPTRMEVRNADGDLAGVTRYKDLKVNSGLSDTLFAG